MFIIELPALLYNLYRYLTGRRRTAREVEDWARERRLEVVELLACRRPPRHVLERFPNRVAMRLFDFRYHELTVIDPDHRRHSGVARVHNRIGIVETMNFAPEVVWLTTEQLDWMDRA